MVPALLLDVQPAHRVRLSLFRLAFLHTYNYSLESSGRKAWS